MLFSFIIQVVTNYLMHLESTLSICCFVVQCGFCLSVSCEVFTKVDRGANGTLHAPAHPVQTAAVYIGDLSSQQRTLTHHVC